MQTKAHWERVYKTNAVTSTSWFQEHLELSLRFIEETGVARAGHIIDVGGGASTLVDDLLDRRFENVTVLDISATALNAARQRLGHRASQVFWKEADITAVNLPFHHYDVWHDRAVFHFLTHAEDRARYVQAVRCAVKPGGTLSLRPSHPTARHSAAASTRYATASTLCTASSARHSSWSRAAVKPMIPPSVQISNLFTAAAGLRL